MVKQIKKPRKIVEQDITEEQFFDVLKKVCRPVKPIESDSKRLQTSVSDRYGDYNEKNTR